MQDEEEFNEFDMKEIEQLAQKNNIFHLLIKSICPTIYGNELVKAGLVLAILGGSQIENESVENKNMSQSERNIATFRNNCHILLIGDPGLGKSQMLKFISSVSNRSVYVCGSATTNAGLTVTVSKDNQTGEGRLEAGALVLRLIGDFNFQRLGSLLH